MKVLILNGSPNENGCTARALREVEKVLLAEGLETEFVTIGNKNIRGCVGCYGCKRGAGKCVIDDDLGDLFEKFQESDGLLVGSPVYFAGANGTLIAALDRLFFGAGFDRSLRVGAAVVSSRRAGSTTAFDEINKYFTISGMPVASSTYWNEVHGRSAADVDKDLEGLQVMRNLGHNMAFLIKSIALGKEKFGAPEKEFGAFTSFCDGL